jgi:hypothetical protein
MKQATAPSSMPPTIICLPERSQFLVRPQLLTRA